MDRLGYHAARRRPDRLEAGRLGRHGADSGHGRKEGGSGLHADRCWGSADASPRQPADWDETAPPTIIDETATMPADWLPDEPSMIPDPEADKPDEWDDEEDGDWVPDMVPNPRCQAVSGCGPWEQPTIANPAYKVGCRLVLEHATSAGGTR